MKSLLTALLFSASLLHAAVPALINYQGLLTDINGNVVSGSKTISISIHDAATSGTQLYSESIGSVTVQNGVYSFQFGSGPEFATALSTGTQHWLEVTIDTIIQTPRERLVSVPFAMKAHDAVTAGLNAAAEARVRTLEDAFTVMRFDDFSYRGNSKPATQPTVVWESFPVPGGTNGRVTSASSGSFYGDRYYALSFSVQDLGESTFTLFAGAPVYKLFKTLTVNAKVHRAEAEFHAPNTNQISRFTFRYSDNTSAQVDSTVGPSYQSVNQIAINPSPEKDVSTIDIYFTSGGTNTFVRNAKVSTLTDATIILSLAPQPLNWSSFRASLLGGRESGDAITFTITNGTTTLSDLSLDTLQTWTGTFPPTSLVLTLTPSATGSVKGTSATTIGVFFNQ